MTELLYHVECSDALAALQQIETSTIDAIVTDPPAGISFMGKAWDGDKGGRKQWTAWLESVMRECLRVLKPGGYALVWALPRTSHWTGSALEDAGFEVRDCLTHIFATGFPKSLNVGKAIDAMICGDFCRAVEPMAAAEPWRGWGTALKPAAEMWWLVRKPLVGTVAANVLAHGTGGLNIDGCRIAGAYDASWTPGARPSGFVDTGADGGSTSPNGHQSPLGRWPANVSLSHSIRCGVAMSVEDGTTYMCAPDCPVAMLDAQSGDRPGASRFFYCAKPSTKEREAGLDHLPKRNAAELVEREEDSAGINNPRAGAGRTSKGRANHHPTVKSIALMRWLVRLITPPGGIVLDPFTGSGTTGCAAVLEGCHFIGVEQDPDYVAIASARIAHWVGK